MGFQIGTALFNANNTTGGVTPSSAPEYNTPTLTVLQDGGDNQMIIAPGEQHALAIACITGSATIVIGGNPAITIEAGTSLEWTAGSLLDQDITITLVSGKTLITTIRRPPFV